MTSAIASSSSGGALHQRRLSPINPQGDELFQVCVPGHYQKRFNSVSQEYAKTNQNGFFSLGPVLKLFTYFKMTTLFPVDPVLGQEMGSFHSVPMIVHLCKGLDCIWRWLLAFCKTTPLQSWISLANRAWQSPGPPLAPSLNGLNGIKWIKWCWKKC